MEKQLLVLKYSYFCNSTKYIHLYMGNYFIKYTVRLKKNNSTVIKSNSISLPRNELSLDGMDEEKLFQYMLLYNFDFDIIKKVQDVIDNCSFHNLTEDIIYGILVKEEKYKVSLYDFMSFTPKINKGSF